MPGSSLDDLERTLRSATAEGSLTLDSGLLGGGPLGAFLDTLPTRRVGLVNVEIRADDADGALLLQGECSVEWHIPGSVAAVRPHRLVARFTEGPDAVTQSVVVLASLPLRRQEIPLVGTVFPGGILSFHVRHAEPVTATFQDLFEVIGLEERGSFLPAPLLELGVVPVGETRIDVAYSSRAPSRVELGCPLDLDLPDEDRQFGLGIDQIRFTATRHELRGMGRRARAGGSLHGHVVLAGNRFDMRIALLPREVVEVEVMPKDGDVLPALTALADLASGEGSGAALQRTLDEHGIVVAVDDVLVRLRGRDLSFHEIGIRGHVDYEGLRF